MTENLLTINQLVTNFAHINEFWVMIVIAITGIALLKTLPGQGNKWFEELSGIPFYKYHQDVKSPLSPLVFSVIIFMLVITSFLILALNNDSSKFIIIFGGVLIAFLIAIIDARYKMIPDELILAMLFNGLIYNIVSNNDISIYMSGIIISFLFMYAIYEGYLKITGHEGMGFGDVKLMAAVGAWVGTSGSFLTIFITSLLMVIFFLFVKVKEGKTAEEPMGPFIAIGFICSILVILP